MKIAYFDCFAGASGDMIIGALLDAGLSIDALSKEYKKLKIGISVRKAKAERNHIVGTRFFVKDAARRYHVDEILKIIKSSSLPIDVKQKSLKIFNRIVAVECKIHGMKSRPHLHEVGALDTIADIVGACAGLKLLGIEKVYTSAFPIPKGYVKTQIGMLPLPAPASLELLKGKPIVDSKIKHELVTPTGAAILSTISEDFGKVPSMKVLRIGYGAGSENFKEIPDLLRIIIGEKIKRL